MIFEGFGIHSSVHLHEAYCECGNTLTEVSNGLLSAALYCEKCENVYIIKKVKVQKNKLTPEFMKQCRFEVAWSKKKVDLRKEFKESF